MLLKVKLTKQPTLGFSLMPNCCISTSVAFSPVVTMAVHCGILSSNAATSVFSTTSKSLSAAVPLVLIIAVAVSNKLSLCWLKTI